MSFSLSPEREPRGAGTAAERTEKPRIAYVVKMYPRFSETFIVSEILAHEAAGFALGIFSLRPPVDTHFQDLLAKVRSPVRYIFSDRPHLTDFWTALSEAGRMFPRFWQSLASFADEDSRDVQQAVLLARELRSGGFTHLHAHFASTASTVARMAARFAGIPFTFTAHAKDIFHESVDAADFRRKLADAAAVITVSDHNVRYLRETYGQAASHVRRIYNGLHLDTMQFSPARDRENVVIAVGRLVEKKGFDDLVRAMASLRDSGNTVRCEIVGTGEMEHELRALVAHLRLEDRVELVGPLPQCEVFKRVASAAVLAAPCVNGADGNRDGLPTVILEAMALGTPCISTPVAGIPEAVRDGETGLLVVERDVAALAGGIGRVLGDADLRCRLAVAGRKLIEDEFDARRNAAAVRGVFSHQRAGAEAA